MERPLGGITSGALDVVGEIRIIEILGGHLILAASG